MESNRFFQIDLRLAWIIVVCTCCCLLPCTVLAQTWDEWFKQKKTQKAYLVKQIALLRVHLTQLKKGYEIVQRGINTVENIKNGDFNLHRDFLSGLKKVNPHIVQSAKVADIIAFQVNVIKDLRNVNEYCRNNKQFTAEEVRYVAAVYSNMLFWCDASISELLMIVQSNKTSMKDAERLKRLDKLYVEAHDRNSFTRTFDQDVHNLARERQREQQTIHRIRSQHTHF